MDLLFIINEIIFQVVEGLFFLLFFIWAVGKRSFIIENKIKTALYLTLYTVFSYWAYMSLPSGIHTIAIALMLIFVSSFLAQCSLRVSFAATLSSMIIITLTEMLTMVFAIFLANVTAFSTNSVPIQKFYFRIAHFCILFTFLFILYRLRINPIFRFVINFQNSNAHSYIYLQGFLICLFYLSMLNITSRPQDTVLYTSLMCILFTLLIILSVFEYIERAKLLTAKFKLEAREEQVKNLETVLDLLRSEKHDFLNHLQTMMLICSSKAPDALEKIETYLEKFAKGLKNSYRFFDSGNDYIDALLSVKSNTAQRLGIHLDIEFETSLEGLGVEDRDLISIFSNILDNAFDALSAHTENIRKTLAVSTFTSDERLCISISNNGPVIAEKDREKIFSLGFSTKMLHKKDHGFGLYIVKQLVSRNHGDIQVSSGETGTEFLIRFPLKQQSAA